MLIAICYKVLAVYTNMCTLVYYGYDMRGWRARAGETYSLSPRECKLLRIPWTSQTLHQSFMQDALV